MQMLKNTLITAMTILLLGSMTMIFAQSGKQKTNAPVPVSQIQAAAQDADVHPRLMTAEEAQLSAELAKAQTPAHNNQTAQLAKRRSGEQALQSATSVLIIWDISTGGTLALKSALESAGITVTLSATSELGYNGANPAPSGFGAVIHLNGTTFSSQMPMSGQNALVAYVQAGGGFLSSEWNAFELRSGRMTAMRDLILFDRTSGIDIIRTLSDVAAQAGHPILANVPSSFSFKAGFNIGNKHAFSTNPVTVLMTDNAGYDAVAVREFGGGRIVGFHHAGNYISSNNTLSNANVLQLYVDGVCWTAGICGGNQPPVADAGDDQEICASTSSASVTLDGSGSSDPDGDALTYTWKESATTVATGENPTVSLSVGSHTIELTVDDGNGGTDTDEVVIDVFASPTADAGADAEIFAGGETTIGGAPTASGGTGALTISWTPTTGLDDPSATNPTAELYSTTTYTVTVTVTDENGCEATDEVTVTVLSKEDVISEQCDAVQALIDDPETPEDATDPLEEAKEALLEAFDFAEEDEIEDMFNAMRDAAEALEKARHEHADTDPIASVLADCARHTATEKREAAFDCDPTPSGKMADDLEDGDNDLADGDLEYGEGYFGDAIKDFRKAWEDYCDALDRCAAPKAVSSSQSSVISDQNVVESFALHQNYPNPFNPRTTIQFDLLEAGHVSLNIYNSAGQLVRSLVSGDYAPGAHKVVWDAKDDAGSRVASGLYLYTINAGQQFNAQRKLLLMK